MTRWGVGLATVCLLVAGPALGATWKRIGGTSTVSTASPGDTVVYDFVAADGTGFGPVLTAPECHTLTAQFDPDMAGTGGTATAYLYGCIARPTNGLGSTNVCGKIIPDTDGDGLPNDTALNGADGTGSVAQRRYIYDISGVTLFAPYVASAASGSETPRFMLTCVPAR